MTQWIVESTGGWESFDITVEDFDQTLGSLRFSRADSCILAQHMKFDLAFDDLH
jgi:hypothetical protein